MSNEIVAAVINEETNVVENVIVLGGVWQAPPGFYLVVSPEAKIGDTYNKTTAKFTTPTPTPLEE